MFCAVPWHMRPRKTALCPASERGSWRPRSTARRETPGVQGLFLIWHFVPLMENLDRTLMEAARAASRVVRAGHQYHRSTTWANTLINFSKRWVIHRRPCTKPVTTSQHAFESLQDKINGTRQHQPRANDQHFDLMSSWLACAEDRINWRILLWASVYHT